MKQGYEVSLWQSRNQIKEALAKANVFDRVKLASFIFLQIILGLGDLIGVLLLGAIVAISFSAVSPSPGKGTMQILVETVFSGMEVSDTEIILILTGIALTLLVSKSLFSMYLMRNLMSVMGNVSCELSRILFSKILMGNKLIGGGGSLQNVIFSVTRGVDYFTLFVVAPAIALVSDFSIVLIFAFGLMIYDPSIVVFLSIFMLIMIWVNSKLVHSKARVLGEENAKLNIAINTKIQEAFEVYRELLVRNSRPKAIDQVVKLRKELAEGTARFNLLPYLSKYLMETGILLFMITVSLYYVATMEFFSAVSMFTVVIVASVRLAPSLLRIQQGLITIKGSIGMSSGTISMLSSTNFQDTTNQISRDASSPRKEKSEGDFSSSIELDSVSFTYPNSSQFKIENVSLSINSGDRFAFVGPSGGGKTTLVDLILGVLEPNSGSISLSGEPPIRCFSKWPAAVAYVPQQVGIINGTIAENLLIGLTETTINFDDIKLSLVAVSLWEFVSELPDGINTNLGEYGIKLSAGQRQRLGLARALLTKPKILVLDEATSALDTSTERQVIKALDLLPSDVTIVAIAHRIGTVKRFNRIAYIEGGKLLAEANFNELRNLVPAFNEQVEEYELQVKKQG